MVFRSGQHAEQLHSVNRRDFVKAVGGASAVGVAAHALPMSVSADDEKPQPEQLVKTLYESLSDEQKSKVCFDWNHEDDRGLLRTHVSNNWSITDRRTLNVGGPFFTNDQQEIIEAIFLGLYNPEWHERIRKQLKDDAGGYGKAQAIAIFGQPDDGKFEFVMTGRHLTIRCDGNSSEHVAFGGPIFYGHAPQFDEKPNHPGNVFWPQAVKANKLYEMLDGRQRQLALVETAPAEADVPFQGKKCDAAWNPRHGIESGSESAHAGAAQTVARTVSGLGSGRSLSMPGGARRTG